MLRKNYNFNNLKYQPLIELRFIIQNERNGCGCNYYLNKRFVNTQNDNTVKKHMNIVGPELTLRIYILLKNGYFTSLSICLIWHG